MKYLLLIYGEESAWAEIPPARAGEILQAYGAYTEKLTKAGVFVAGEELDAVAKAKSVRGVGGTQVLDGPFVDTKEALGGFYLIECGSEAEALSWAKQAPTMLHGGGIEVRPAMMR
ncbi:MAG: YciI family protein [Alphaproteobacteria bacterium]|nr:YciI family protein [Alphaproteobacteria bacterium]